MVMQKPPGPTGHRDVVRVTRKRGDPLAPRASVHHRPRRPCGGAAAVALRYRAPGAELGFEFFMQTRQSSSPNLIHNAAALHARDHPLSTCLAYREILCRCSAAVKLAVSDYTRIAKVLNDGAKVGPLIPAMVHFRDVMNRKAPH